VSWDPFQRDVLAELGFVVYQQAGSAMAPDVEAARFDAPQPEPASIDGSMLARVAHAAGMTADALQGCFGDMQLIASLHGNAAAKRALWPRLRALRRQQA